MMTVTGRMVLAAVAAAWALTGTADTAAHRRQVRERIANPATRAAAIEAALQDEDPAVRRYASFMKTGRDPDRPAGARKLHRTNVPLSQDPANDHEVSSVLSVKAKDGAFTLPEKPACDGVELWFAPLKDDDLQVWLNGIYLGQFHRERPADGQDFRLNAAAEAKWGAANAVVIRDGAGKEVVRDFTAEVVKCGK